MIEPQRHFPTDRIGCEPRTSTARNVSSAFGALVRDMLTDPTVTRPAVPYFHGLDLLRGLAAVSILFWHYSHFFVEKTTFVPHAPGQNPLYDQFWLLYEHGGNAVQLFWLISGFTFSAVYTRRQATTRAFAVHRIARLYPLHLLTLVLVAVLQVASTRLTGHFLIYPNNDAAHFVDQLLLTSGWGPTIRFSFNGPIWTVSVELLVYALFWILLPQLFRAGPLIPAAIAAASFMASRLGPFEHILQGCLFYFAGCAAFPVFLACRGRRSATAAATLLPIGIGVVLLVGGRAGAGSAVLLSGLMLGGAFVDFERLWPAAKRAAGWLGENTYGTYLWHVPVQIVILLAADTTGFPRAWFLEPWFLLAYLSGVMLIARASFLLFERPCRTYLNTYLSDDGRRIVRTR